MRSFADFANDQIVKLGFRSGQFPPALSSALASLDQTARCSGSVPAFDLLTSEGPSVQPTGSTIVGVTRTISSVLVRLTFLD